jgi:hypothetical protein
MEDFMSMEEGGIRERSSSLPEENSIKQESEGKKTGASKVPGKYGQVKEAFFKRMSDIAEAFTSNSETRVLLYTKVTDKLSEAGDKLHEFKGHIEKCGEKIANVLKNHDTPLPHDSYGVEDKMHAINERDTSRLESIRNMREKIQPKVELKDEETALINKDVQQSAQSLAKVNNARRMQAKPAFAPTTNQAASAPKRAEPSPQEQVEFNEWIGVEGGEPLLHIKGRNTDASGENQPSTIKGEDGVVAKRDSTFFTDSGEDSEVSEDSTSESFGFPEEYDSFSEGDQEVIKGSHQNHENITEQHKKEASNSPELNTENVSKKDIRDKPKAPENLSSPLDVGGSEYSDSSFEDSDDSKLVSPHAPKDEIEQSKEKNPELKIRDDKKSKPTVANVIGKLKGLKKGIVKFTTAKGGIPSSKSKLESKKTLSEKEKMSPEEKGIQELEKKLAADIEKFSLGEKRREITSESETDSATEFSQSSEEAATNLMEEPKISQKKVESKHDKMPPEPDLMAEFDKQQDEAEKRFNERLAKGEFYPGLRGGYDDSDGS